MGPIVGNKHSSICNCPVCITVYLEQNIQKGSTHYGHHHQLFKSLYQKVSDQLNRMIPPPQAHRAVNPYIAAGLELLGYIGLLGFGRMYAGDMAGGLSALAMWLVVLAGMFTFAFIVIVLAILLAIPTLGISFILVGFLGLLIIPIIILPALSAI
jgi:hypothetical protein